ncbi:hypothetical protein, partial [Lentimonas sp. CC19]
MNFRQRLQCLLGIVMLGLGLLFITGPIHFEPGIARSEKRIKEELDELLSHTDFDLSEKEWKKREIERPLEILIGTRNGVM